MAKQKADGERLLGYCETAVFGGVDDGGVQRTKARFSVNQPVTAPNLKHQSRVAGVRVKVTEEEMKEGKIDGDQMTFYEKEVKVKQEPMGAKPSDEYDGEEHSYPMTGKSNGEPTNLGVLKNFVDTIEKRVTRHDTWITVLAIIATAAIILGAIATFKPV